MSPGRRSTKVATPAGQEREPARRGADTRARLVEAALEAFERDGFHGTDSNRIARAAGFAPQTFYRHFPDKRAIFLAAYDAWVGAEWADVRAALAHPVAGERTRLVTAAVLEHHRRWHRLRLQIRLLTLQHPEIRTHWLAERRRQLDDLEAMHRAHGGGADRAELAFLLLAIERVADGLAAGELEALGVAPDDVRRALERTVEACTRATPSSSPAELPAKPRRPRASDAGRRKVHASSVRTRRSKA